MKFGNTTIVGMSFGSTKIGGAKYGNTLVFDGGGSPTPDPGSLSNYVQDGLVLHLDGINKGGTSGRWSSLVGSTYYTLNTHSTEETNAILMDGAGYITATSPVSVNYKSGTIEVCAQILGVGAYALVYGPTNTLSFSLGNSGNMFSFGVKSPADYNSWALTPQSLFTMSMNSDRCCLNGASTGEATQEGWGNNLSSYTIGGREYGTNKYYANARIYSIRFYNRKLTESEMLNNQAVDNARFNLGLNIQ